MRRVISRVARRVLEGVVVTFAALGFFVVPLGDRTGFQHACAVLDTDAAKNAASGFSRTVTQLHQNLWQAPVGTAPTPAPPSSQVSPSPLSRTAARADLPDASL